MIASKPNVCNRIVTGFALGNYLWYLLELNKHFRTFILYRLSAPHFDFPFGKQHAHNFFSLFSTFYRCMTLANVWQYNFCFAAFISTCFIKLPFFHPRFWYYVRKFIWIRPYAWLTKSFSMIIHSKLELISNQRAHTPTFIPCYRLWYVVSISHTHTHTYSEFSNSIYT